MEAYHDVIYIRGIRFTLPLASEWDGTNEECTADGVDVNGFRRCTRHFKLIPASGDEPARWEISQGLAPKESVFY